MSTQQNINKLGSVFGGLKNYFRPPKSAFHKSTSQPQISSSEKKKIEATQKAAVQAVTTRPTNPANDTDTYFGKPRSAMDDMEKETEDGLRKFIQLKSSGSNFAFLFLCSDEIHAGVNRLKVMALQMNQELESQKPLTDRLAVKIDRLNDGVNKQNKEMKTILLR